MSMLSSVLRRSLSFELVTSMKLEEMRIGMRVRFLPTSITGKVVLLSSLSELNAVSFYPDDGGNCYLSGAVGDFECLDKLPLSDDPVRTILLEVDLRIDARIEKLTKEIAGSSRLRS